MIKNRKRMSTTHKIHKLVFLLDRIAEQMIQAQLGISFSQFLILMGIIKHKGPSQRDVSMFMNITEGAVSRQIEHLHERKFIVRKQQKGNRRKHILEVTPQGKEVYEKAVQLLDEKLDSLYETFSPEEETVLDSLVGRLLEKLIKDNNLDECYIQTGDES